MWVDVGSPLCKGVLTFWLQHFIAVNWLLHLFHLIICDLVEKAIYLIYQKELW